MGTNFYDEKGQHLGKRSAAGYYCWDCGITLCMDGAAFVHHGRAETYNRCPICGQKKRTEDDLGSAGRELGFNKSDFSGRKSGVRSCSSFTWNVKSGARLSQTNQITDEYGRVYTKEEFLQLLQECPLQFHSEYADFS